MSVMVADAPPVAGPGEDGTKLVWRPLVRMAWRDAVRRKGRTALVVALIAVPVGLLLLASVVLRSANLSQRQRNLLTLGATADAVLQLPPSTTDLAGPTPPESWQQTSVTDIGYVRVKMNGRYRFTSLAIAQLDHPLLRGAYTITRGVAPTGDDTAAVSTDVARRYGVGIGAVLTMRDGQTMRVVGTFEQAADVRRATLVVAERPRSAVRANGVSDPSAVYAKAGDPNAVDQWLARPSSVNVGVVVSRGPLSTKVPFLQGNPERFMPVVITYTLGTTGLFLVGIVVSAAFAVSARRQLRTLGLVAANGASPSVLARLMAAQGVVTGLVGTIVGLALGVTGLAALAPHLNRFVGLRLPGLRVPPGQVVVVAAMGVATAALAAWLPGRAVARVPTLAALGGRRPVEPVAARVPIIGALLMAAGLVLLGSTVGAGGDSALREWARLVGSIGGLMLGGVLCMPWFIGQFEGAARRWTGARRLAARSLARNRSRSGPIAAAILVTVGAAAAAATFDESNRQVLSQLRDRVAPRSVTVQTYRESGDGTDLVPTADVVERVRAIVPDATIVRFRSLVTTEATETRVKQGGTTVTLLVLGSDEASVRSLAGDAAADAFRAGRAVVLGPGHMSAGTISLELLTDGVGDPTRVDLPAFELPKRVLLGDEVRRCSPDGTACGDPGGPPTVLLPDDVARTFGFTPSNGTVVQLTRSRTFSAAQVQRLRELNAVLDGEQVDQAETTGDAVYTKATFDDVRAPSPRTLQWILNGIVLLLALSVTGIGLALTTTENRADDAALLALGAPPRFRRRVRVWEALLLTGSGAVLAVPLGYVVGAVALANGGGSKPIPFPWRSALLLGVALPLVAGAVFGLFARTPRIVLVRED